MINCCCRSNARVPRLAVTFLLLTVALLGTSLHVEAVQSSFAKSQPEPTLQNPIKTQYVLVKGTSWMEVDNELLKLTVTLKNTGNQRVQYFGVRVRYKSKTGEPLGGRGHYIRESIEPGQMIQVSLPEARPPDADGDASVTARAIPR